MSPSRPKRSRREQRLELGEAAYKLKAAGATWAQVRSDLGDAACAACRFYIREAGKPWPILGGAQGQAEMRTKSLEERWRQGAADLRERGSERLAEFELENDIVETGD